MDLMGARSTATLYLDVLERAQAIPFYPTQRGDYHGSIRANTFFLILSTILSDFRYGAKTSTRVGDIQRVCAFERSFVIDAHKLTPGISFSDKWTSFALEMPYGNTPLVGNRHR